MIENVSDLAAYQFDLAFEKYILSIPSSSDVTISSVLKDTTRTYGNLGPVIDNDHGIVTAGEYSYGEGSGANITDAKKIATVTFKVLDQQCGTIKLQEVQLYDTSGNPIEYEVEDATFTPAGAPIPTLQDIGKIVLIFFILISSFFILQRRKSTL